MTNPALHIYPWGAETFGSREYDALEEAATLARVVAQKERAAEAAYRERFEPRWGCLGHTEERSRRSRAASLRNREQAVDRAACEFERAYFAIPRALRGDAVEEAYVESEWLAVADGLVEVRVRMLDVRRDFTGLAATTTEED